MMDTCFLKKPRIEGTSSVNVLQASLLVVDDLVLSSISLDLLGGDIGPTGALDSSVWAYALSFWLSGM